MGPPRGDVGWGWMNVLAYGISGSRMFISGMKWFSRLELASSLKFGEVGTVFVTLCVGQCDILHRLDYPFRHCLHIYGCGVSILPW